MTITIQIEVKTTLPITRSEFDALLAKDPHTLYIVTES
jgi:hypothetical protein